MSDKQGITLTHEAFEAGKQAALSGQPVGGNPHPPGSENHQHWLKGFEFVEKFDEDGEIPSDP